MDNGRVCSCCSFQIILIALVWSFEFSLIAGENEEAQEITIEHLPEVPEKSKQIESSSEESEVEVTIEKPTPELQKKLRLSRKYR